MYHLGQILRMQGLGTHEDLYMIVQGGTANERGVGLINLANGNFWSDFVKVSSISNITQAELDSMIQNWLRVVEIVPNPYAPKNPNPLALKARYSYDVPVASSDLF